MYVVFRGFLNYYLARFSNLHIPIVACLIFITDTCNEFIAFQKLQHLPLITEGRGQKHTCGVQTSKYDFLTVLSSHEKRIFHA